MKMKQLLLALLLLTLTFSSACGEGLSLNPAPAGGDAAPQEDTFIDEPEELIPDAAPVLGPVKPLPIDLSAGPAPSESGFTEDSYQDGSLIVKMERVTVGNDLFNVARVTVADASQLRTALSAKYSANMRQDKISTIAKKNNAVVAIGGDYFGNNEGGYLVRQGQVYRKKPFKKRDMLVIDGNGDFHILVLSDAAQLKALREGDIPMVNVFNFGPALVIDGALQEIPKDYQFNPNGHEPRCAIGQTGPLSYLLVVVDGRRKNSDGCTMQELAQFMYDQGCVQAYNLDGGNSALMVFHGENSSDKSVEAERSVTDIIYFATAIDSGK